ncbi:hypothetical protein [Kutzneria kofuensis]|uniref:IrrE N-terminal-like domain-containing protein n=1 Tax=Kutzneria kofuensis TaxID=103725 RepID=A0A7W9KP10_9PSEU|nr:hypothetical protein [Kutzneria kofuensis]MBB5895992.1 hypothetical protein [Kutzneria kofuensis]
MGFTSWLGRAHRQRQVARAVRDLLAAVPVGTDLDAFVRRLARLRNRPVSLVPFSEVVPDVAAPFSGLWVKAPRLDCIVYDDTAPQATQRHAVFHEVAHMLLGHLSTEDIDGLQLRLMSALLPDLQPQVIKRTVRAGLCRSNCGYVDEQEEAAERFATELGARVSEARLIHPIPPPDPSDLAVIARFMSTLGPRKRP